MTLLNHRQGLRSALSSHENVLHCSTTFILSTFPLPRFPRPSWGQWSDPGLGWWEGELLWCGGVWLAEVLLPLLLLLLPAAGLTDAAQDAGRGQQEEGRGHQHDDADPHQDTHHLRGIRTFLKAALISINSGWSECGMWEPHLSVMNVREFFFFPVF